MSQKTIVYANTIDYDHPLQQRPMHLMNQMSKNGYKVYWINETQRTDKIRDRINENFEVYHNFDVFLKRVSEVDIYFYSWSQRYIDIPKINAKLKIYDSLDNFEANEHNETFAVNAADILLVTSDPLYQLRKSQHNNIHMVKNACFLEMGEQDYPIPEDLIPFKKSGKPILLFSGALASWVDIQLIEKTAQKYQVVVVGMPWGIQMPKGVHYLGKKGYQELQAYYHHCDVNLLPFLRCQTSDYSHPLKMMEAMAHGKPTVSTDIPEALNYGEVVLSSKNHMEFISNIQKAIRLSKENDFQQKAKQIASENTWEQRFQTIDSAIQQFFTTK